MEKKTIEEIVRQFGDRVDMGTPLCSEQKEQGGCLNCPSQLGCGKVVAIKELLSRSLGLGRVDLTLILKVQTIRDLLDAIKDPI